MKAFFSPVTFSLPFLGTAQYFVLPEEVGFKSVFVEVLVGIDSIDLGAAQFQFRNDINDFYFFHFFPHSPVTHRR